MATKYVHKLPTHSVDFGKQGTRLPLELYNIDIGVEGKNNCLKSSRSLCLLASAQFVDVFIRAVLTRPQALANLEAGRLHQVF